MYCQRRFSSVKRWLLLLGGVGILSLLLVARCLQPDRSGYGTHQQLGLPPCTSVALIGQVCPSCGMTTAWAHLTRGEFGSAVAANAGGTLLGLCAILASPWLIVSATLRQWLLFRPTERGLVIVAAVIGAVVLSDWCIKVYDLF